MKVNNFWDLTFSRVEIKKLHYLVATLERLKRDVLHVKAQQNTFYKAYTI